MKVLRGDHRLTPAEKRSQDRVFNWIILVVSMAGLIALLFTGCDLRY